MVTAGTEESAIMTDSGSFYDDMEGKLDERKAQRDEEFDGDGNTWQPDEGDTLKGVFVQVKYIETRYGVKPLALVRPLNGDALVEVWCSAMVLNEEMEGLAPSQGTPIGIRFEGLQTSDAGNDYNLHTVMIPERDEAQIAVGQEYWRTQQANPKMKRARQAPRQPATGGTAGGNQGDLAPF